MSLVGLLFLLIVLGLLYYLITLLPLPAPFPLIIKVVLILFLIVMLLDWSGVLGGGGFSLGTGHSGLFGGGCR